MAELAAKNRSAAFIRVEGVLLEGGLLPAIAYLAANGQGFSERVFRLLRLGITSPVHGLLSLTDPESFLKLAFSHLRGMSQDRISFLAREYVCDIAEPRWRKRLEHLVHYNTNLGRDVVLVSEGIEEWVHPVMEAFGPSMTSLHNSLDYVDGAATGSLRTPIVGGFNRDALETFAARNGYDLSTSVGYASKNTDRQFLEWFGGSQLVNPDPLLRATANKAKWPILEL